MNICANPWLLFSSKEDESWGRFVNRRRNKAQKRRRLWALSSFAMFGPDFGLLLLFRLFQFFDRFPKLSQFLRQLAFEFFDFRLDWFGISISFRLLRCQMISEGGTSVAQ